MIRRPPRSTLSSSSAASDVYKRQGVKPTPKAYLANPPTSRISCVTLQSIFQISHSFADTPWELVFIIAPGDDTPVLRFLKPSDFLSTATAKCWTLGRNGGSKMHLGLILVHDSCGSCPSCVHRKINAVQLSVPLRPVHLYSAWPTCKLRLWYFRPMPHHA